MFCFKKNAPFTIHRLHGNRETDRIIVSARGKGSRNFDADMFLSTFSLNEAADLSGKKLLVLSLAGGGEETGEEIILASGLNDAQLQSAKALFFSQLYSMPPQGMRQRGVMYDPPRSQRIKKRYLAAATMVVLSAYLFWPLDNAAYVEITDPEILALIEEKSNGATTALPPLSTSSEDYALEEARRDKQRSSLNERVGTLHLSSLRTPKGAARTTSVLSPEANELLHKMATVHSIVLGDLDKEGATPYLVFSSPKHGATTDLILGTEEIGYTPVLIPVDFIEHDGQSETAPLLRVVASYCSNDPIRMWTQPTLTEEDVGQMNVADACDWKEALLNFNRAWVTANADGLTDAPIIVAPNGAIHQHNESEGVTPTRLVNWLAANHIEK